jgi:hypothetical protein
VKEDARNGIGKLRDKLKTKQAKKWIFIAEDEDIFSKVKKLVCGSVKDGVA